MRCWVFESSFFCLSECRDCCGGFIFEPFFYRGASLGRKGLGQTHLPISVRRFILPSLLSARARFEPLWAIVVVVPIASANIALTVIAEAQFDPLTRPIPAPEVFLGIRGGDWGGGCHPIVKTSPG
jgi:hypothetical protein